MTSDRAPSVLLVRHGRTALNAEGRLRGLADPELDEIGIAQAHATAIALQPLGIGRVLSSPLRRARRTAAIIADASGLAPETDPAFNDRDYGPWTGHLKADVIREWGSVDDAPGVEDQQAVLGRALPALDACVHAGAAPIVVVTHDAVIRPLLDRIQPGISVVVDTCSWAELARTSEGWSIVSVDNTAS